MCRKLSRISFPEKLDGLFIRGVYVRKGTIGATIKNVKNYNETNVNEQKIAIIQSIKKIIPALEALGFFEVYPLNYFLRAKDSGSVALGILYAKHMVDNEQHPALLNMDLPEDPILQSLINNEVINVTDIKGFEPQDLIPDGDDFTNLVSSLGVKVKGRKGTIKSFMTCIEQLTISKPDSKEYENAVHIIREIAPALDGFGLTKIFPLDSQRLKDSRYYKGLMIAKNIL